MATAGEMVAAVAALFAVNTSTVESIDRVLSDAGLRQKGGRGRSAATMSGSDVANLALAMILDASMKDAVAKVGKVAAMPLQSATVQWRPVSELPLPPLSQQVDQYHEHPAVAGELDMFPAGSALVSSSSLGAGLAALITAMAENEFRELDEMTINLQMSSHGPSALLVYETRAGVLRVRYETLGPEAERPVFERRLKLDEALLHRLADIIRLS